MTNQGFNYYIGKSAGQDGSPFSKKEKGKFGPSAVKVNVPKEKLEFIETALSTVPAAAEG